MQNPGITSSLEKDLTKTRLRFVILALTSLMSFGSYFVYDNPSALQTQLQDALNIGTFEFNLFYSVYSFPNIILPILGGYFIDVIGNRIGALFFSILIVIGQGLFAFGVMIDSFNISLLGRGVFGLGGESLNVSSNYYITNWFAGNELAMAIGTTVSVSRLGSVLNDNIEPVIVDSTGSLSFGLWVGFLFCIFSLVCVVVANVLDGKKDRNLGIVSKKHLPDSEKFRFRDFKFFGFSFWCLCFNCLVVYIDVSCFNNIASNYFQERFGFNSIESGSIISITYIIAAFLCPVFGILVDKFGRRVQFMMFSTVSITLVHVAFLLTPESNKPIYPIFYMVLLGLGYSIYASVMWASIPYLIKPKVAGTAFGMATAVQNFGLCFGPLLVGYIQENTSKDKGYYWVSFFFVMVGICGIFTCILIYFNDVKTGGVLHSKDPEKVRESFVGVNDEEKAGLRDSYSAIN